MCCRDAEKGIDIFHTARLTNGMEGKMCNLIDLDISWAGSLEWIIIGGFKTGYNL